MLTTLADLILISKNSSRSRAELVNQIDKIADSGFLYALGQNNESSTLSSKIFINSFIDDFASPGTTFKGKPIIKSREVPHGSLVVNCSTSIAPVSAFNNLNLIGNFDVINYSDLMLFMPERFDPPRFVSDMRREFSFNHDKIERTYTLLNDDTSIKTFNDIISFRLTADPLYMANYSIRLKEQYFEKFLPWNQCIFVDAGGFDGDTSEILCNRYSDYKKIYFFEPSAPNLMRAKKRLSNFSNIEYFSLALSNNHESLRFDENSGSSSAINSEGINYVNATTLDSIIKDPVTIIKMDLEGWELQALEGAKIQIQKYKPALAIAGYHYSSDLWRIPEFIFNIRQDYKLYVRHYTEGWSETVFFFV